MNTHAGCGLSTLCHPSQLDQILSSAEGFGALASNDSDTQRWLIVKPSKQLMESPVKDERDRVHLLGPCDRDQEYIRRWDRQSKTISG